MCMKYVNVTTTCFKSVVIENNRIISFNGPFNSIKSIDADDKLLIGDFSIITQINFLGTASDEHRAENPLEKKQKIDFTIRLTKCDKVEENRIGFDLDQFSIDLEEMYNHKQVDSACFDYLNHTRITNVECLNLPGGTGKYVIKILARESEDEEYTIQSMAKLIIM